MQNPFEFGRELGADELVNRSDELDTVSSIINSGGKLFVIGPRRFGKTSLLKAAAELSGKRGNVVLRCDAESFSDISGLVRKIIEDSAHSLKGRVEKTGEQIKTYFKSLRPELSFSVTQTEWKASIGATPSSPAGQVKLLVDAFNGLEKFAEDLPAKKRVALIIDEFQEVINTAGIAAEKQIRSAIQTHRHTAYIFAGSKTSMLTGMTTDPSRPFYRLGALLSVGPLPRPEFARFLIDKFTLADFFSPKIAESEKIQLAHRILDSAEDVPYNVQMLAHELWNTLSQVSTAAPEKAHLTADLINEALEKLIRRNDPFYTQVWNKLTPIQKKTLSSVVAQKGSSLLSGQVVRSTGVSPSSLRRALESLVNQDILRTGESKGRIQYLFEDPFFAHWIRLFTY